MSDMEKAPPPGMLPPELKFLKTLVTALTVTMIVGLLVIVALLVTRFAGAPAQLALPESITLPDGVVATAYTQGLGWYAVVTANQEILIYDSESGAIRQRIQVDLGKNTTE